VTGIPAPRAPHGETAQGLRDAQLSLMCSSGSRAIARDPDRALDSAAHLAALRRLALRARGAGCGHAGAARHVARRQALILPANEESVDARSRDFSSDPLVRSSERGVSLMLAKAMRRFIKWALSAGGTCPSMRKVVAVFGVGTGSYSSRIHTRLPRHDVPLWQLSLRRGRRIPHRVRDAPVHISFGHTPADRSRPALA